MSVRRLAADQPESFAFTAENLEWAKSQLKKYPDGKQASAVLAILWRAQEQMGGWLPEPALRYVADLLGLAYIRIYEIATFYTMFNLAPVGRYYVQVCGTTPCWLRGADAIKDTCRKLIGAPNHVTDDGLFSWTEVECLGACVNAPMAQINKDYYEDLTPESLTHILAELKAGRHPKPGPQNGRQTSAPLGGPITLTDPDLYQNELPDDAPPDDELYRNEEASDVIGSPLSDDEPKKPGEAADQRARAVPKPPLGKSRKPGPN